MLIDCDTHSLPKDAFDYIEGPLAKLRPFLKVNDKGLLVGFDFPGRPAMVPGTTPIQGPGGGAVHIGLIDLDVRMRDYDRMGVDIHFELPNFSGWWSYLIEPKLATAMAHSLNLAFLRAMDAHPGRLVGVALVALQDVEEAIQELEWAVEHGFRAVVVDHTYPVPEHPLGTPVASHREVWPFFQRCEELQVPIFLHPVQHGHRIVNALPFQMDGLDIYAPKDAEMNLVAIITSGLLDAYPRLQFIHAEQGTRYLQPLAQRLDGLHKGMFPTGYHEDEGASKATRRKRVLSPNAPQLVPPELAAEKNKRLPSYYFRNNFSWTIETEEPELPSAIQFLGADRFLFATDYPHEDPGGQKKFEDRQLLQDNPHISDADKELIRHGNAERLFHINGG
jgi:predicted TIM-barrel fold metal-dependent hydrolase